MTTDLVIIGAGAAGLMAGAVAGEAGLHAVLVERKHRPGLKLLMCGNNRCNVTHDLDPDNMLLGYGGAMGKFLGPAIRAFSPRDLRQWFSRNRLQTTVHKDGRVFPCSEKADDVLHCFTDVLRDQNVPVVYNASVSGLERDGDAWVTSSDHFAFRSPYVLVATGGVSYPKTGSVGDGQRFAKQLGHRVLPFRPGLAGLELDGAWLKPRQDISIPGTAVGLFAGEQCVGQTAGEILLTRSCARGPAMVDASRLMGRLGLSDVLLCVDLCPHLSIGEVIAHCAEALGRKGKPDWGRILSHGILPAEFAVLFAGNVLAGLAPGSDEAAACSEAVASQLKAWRVGVIKVRPLKEAMVTIGGVDLGQIDPSSMESLVCPGMYFVGEVLDVDGPTGGYNLHAAFSTARLAVATIAARCGGQIAPSSPKARQSGRPTAASGQQHRSKQRGPRRRQR